ncbi:MAG TPA: hypothetical protein PK829_02400 [Promineifilum sp.]|nr:hypothetical protein [Promineifilum sp.]
MRHWLRLPLFVLVGVLTAAVGELQYSVLIRGDWANLLGSMVFNAVYLIAAFVVVWALFRLLPRRAAFLACVILAAVAGLGVEWFLIGNSPRGNPDASQLGMAAYWAGMVVVPLIVMDGDARLRPLKRRIAVFAAVYTLAVLLGQWLLPVGDWRFAFHILTVILGYLGLLVLCVVGYLRNARSGSLALLADEPGRLDIQHD